MLTPVQPGQEHALADCLARLSQAGESPLSRLADTHFARWVVLTGTTSHYRGAPRPARPLRMRYLLFTSTANSPAERHVEDLRTRLRGDADAVWGHCVGYPGHERRADFCRYLLHNRLPTHRWFAAYDATVQEVREALALRRRHADLAARTQTADDRELQRAFLDEFGQGGT
ncbi:MAG TPA: hypothetical protein VHF92_10845 [Geodermatophilus sp.]|nr:hypothetical protein [Geodermatophilus sp.]